MYKWRFAFMAAKQIVVCWQTLRTRRNNLQHCYITGLTGAAWRMTNALQNYTLSLQSDVDCRSQLATRSISATNSFLIRRGQTDNKWHFAAIIINLSLIDILNRTILYIAQCIWARASYIHWEVRPRNTRVSIWLLPDSICLRYIGSWWNCCNMPKNMS